MHNPSFWIKCLPVPPEGDLQPTHFWLNIIRSVSPENQESNSTRHLRWPSDCLPMTNLTLTATSSCPHTPSLPSPWPPVSRKHSETCSTGFLCGLTGPASSYSLGSLGPSSSTSYLAPLCWQKQGIQRCWEAERGLLSPECRWRD